MNGDFARATTGPLLRDHYYASEVDEDGILVSRVRYPAHLIHVILPDSVMTTVLRHHLMLYTTRASTRRESPTTPAHPIEPVFGLL